MERKFEILQRLLEAPANQYSQLDFYSGYWPELAFRQNPFDLKYTFFRY